MNSAPFTEIDINTILVHRPLRHTEKTPSGRTYHRSTLEAFVTDWKNSGKTIFGTLGERTVDLSQAHVTDLSKVATIIVDMYVDDEGLVVQQKMVDTPAGQKLLELLRNGVKISVLPRIIGRLDENQNVYDAKFYGVVIADEGTNPASVIE